MKDYSAMSDFEINCEVSKLTRDNANNPDSGYLVINDYCNNPADAWPIIEGSYISIQFYQGNWMASVSPSHGNGFRSACFIGKAPLRAGMIVFLMVREGE